MDVGEAGGDATADENLAPDGEGMAHVEQNMMQAAVGADFEHKAKCNISTCIAGDIHDSANEADNIRMLKLQKRCKFVGKVLYICSPRMEKVRSHLLDCDDNIGKC